MCDFCEHIYPSFDDYFEHTNELESHYRDDQNNTQGIHFDLVRDDHSDVYLAADSIVDYDDLNQNESMQIHFCPKCGRSLDQKG